MGKQRIRVVIDLAFYIVSLTKVDKSSIHALEWTIVHFKRLSSRHIHKEIDIS